MLFLAAINCEETRSKLEQLYSLYSRDLLQYSSSMLHDYQQAEDIVQNTFIKVSDYIDKTTDVNDKKIRAFLFLISKNLILDYKKSSNYRNIISISDYETELKDSSEFNPENVMLKLDQQKEIAKKLSSIKDDYSNIITLKYYFEYSNNEIASILSISDSNVRTRLHRAHKALLRIMGGSNNDQRKQIQ